MDMNMNPNNNFKPENRNSTQSRKLFSDPKINKILIGVGIVFALIIILAIVFVCLPTSMFV